MPYCHESGLILKIKKSSTQNSSIFVRDVNGFSKIGQNAILSVCVCVRFFSIISKTALTIFFKLCTVIRFANRRKTAYLIFPGKFAKGSYASGKSLIFGLYSILLKNGFDSSIGMHIKVVKSFKRNNFCLKYFLEKSVFSRINEPPQYTGSVKLSESMGCWVSLNLSRCVDS